MIVVTAAGGRTGTAVVRALRAQGRPVRAVVASARARPELDDAGAEVVVADLADPTTVAPLLSDADALYLMWPNFDPRETAGATALLDAARAAGVGRVVYHSVLRPQARSMPHHAAKDRVEEHLDRSGLAWRVLQPCAYADNLDGVLAGVAATGRFPSAWGLDHGQSLVDVRDVADAASGAADRGRAGRRHVRGRGPGVPHGWAHRRPAGPAPRAAGHPGRRRP